MQIAGFDLGTHSIKLIVAETQKHGVLKVLKIFKFPSGGLRRGALVDMDDAVAATNNIFQLLRKRYRPASRNIFINVNGPQISTHSSKGIIAVSRADSEICQDDIERAIKGSQAVNLSPNRKILHTLTKEFIVDGVRDITDPSGLIGNRLEVESVIVSVFAQYIQNLTRLVEINGCKIGGFILSPLAGARAALTKKQLELGVALVDIGAATTGISVYEEGKLLHAAVFPLGAANITNDIAVGFKMPVEYAEAVKMHFGHAVSRQIPPRETAELKAISADIKNAISRRFLAEIIESRLAEIFDFVNNELKKIGKYGQLPAGIVLVGGGTKLPGIVELAKQELHLSCHIGLNRYNFEIADPDCHDELEEPDFVCASGLALWGEEVGKKGTLADAIDWNYPFSSLIKSVLKNLLP